MKIHFILLFAFCALTMTLSAQQLEIFGGINSNHLHDSYDENGMPYTSLLRSERGYTIGISYDNPNMNGFANRITLSYNQIKGGVATTFTDTDETGSFTSANIEKKSFNVAVYPFTFIVQKIYIGFGLQANITLSNNTEGAFGTTNIVGQTKMDISQASEPEFHKDLGYGVAMRAHYNIMLNNGLSIIPHYNLYYGIGEEYATAESEKIKVWQQVLAIGIGMQF